MLTSHTSACLTKSTYVWSLLQIKLFHALRSTQCVQWKQGQKDMKKKIRPALQHWLNSSQFRGIQFKPAFSIQPCRATAWHWGMAHSCSGFHGRHRRMPCLPRKHNKSRIRSTPILLSGEMVTQHKGKIDFPSHSSERKDLLDKIPPEGSKVSSRTPDTSVITAKAKVPAQVSPICSFLASLVSLYKKNCVIKKKTGYKRLSAEPSLTCCPHSFGDSYSAVIENFLLKCLSWRQAEECYQALIRKLWKQGYKQDRVNYTPPSQFHCKTLFWTLPQPPLPADNDINR